MVGLVEAAVLGQVVEVALVAACELEVALVWVVALVWEPVLDPASELVAVLRDRRRR